MAAGTELASDETFVIETPATVTAELPSDAAAWAAVVRTAVEEDEEPEEPHPASTRPAMSAAHNASNDLRCRRNGPRLDAERLMFLLRA